jgi:hypothetical protein
MFGAYIRIRMEYGQEYKLSHTILEITGLTLIGMRLVTINLLPPTIQLIRLQIYMQFRHQ